MNTIEYWFLTGANYMCWTVTGTTQVSSCPCVLYRHDSLWLCGHSRLLSSVPGGRYVFSVISSRLNSIMLAYLLFQLDICKRRPRLLRRRAKGCRLIGCQPWHLNLVRFAWAKLLSVSKEPFSQFFTSVHCCEEGIEIYLSYTNQWYGCGFVWSWRVCN